MALKIQPLLPNDNKGEFKSAHFNMNRLHYATYSMSDDCR